MEFHSLSQQIWGLPLETMRIKFICRIQTQRRQQSTFLRPAAGSWTAAGTVWGRRGGCGVLPPDWACVCVSVSVSQLAEQSSAAEHSGRTSMLGSVQGHTAGSLLVRSHTDMFDNANYPFNCFNYDGDGYPSSSTDEEKKMCRPAYR